MALPCLEQHQVYECHGCVGSRWGYYLTGLGDGKVSGRKSEEEEGRKARRKAVRPQEKGGRKAGAGRLPHLGDAKETLGQTGKVSPDLERSSKLASSSCQVWGPKRSLLFCYPRG